MPFAKKGKFEDPLRSGKITYNTLNYFYDFINILNLRSMGGLCSNEKPKENASKIIPEEYIKEEDPNDI